MQLSLRMATYPLASKHYSLCIRCSDSAQRCVGKSYTSMRASAARLSAASASSLTLFAASPAASPPPSSVVFASSEGSLTGTWTCSGHRGYHRIIVLMSKSKHVQVLTERRHHANTATCLLWPALLGTPVRPGRFTAAAQPSVAMCLWRSPAFGCGNGCCSSNAPDWRQIRLDQRA